MADDDYKGADAADAPDAQPRTANRRSYRDYLDSRGIPRTPAVKLIDPVAKPR